MYSQVVQLGWFKDVNDQSLKLLFEVIILPRRSRRRGRVQTLWRCVRNRNVAWIWCDLENRSPSISLHLNQWEDRFLFEDLNVFLLCVCDHKDRAKVIINRWPAPQQLWWTVLSNRLNRSQISKPRSNLLGGKTSASSSYCTWMDPIWWRASKDDWQVGNLRPLACEILGAGIVCDWKALTWVSFHQLVACAPQGEIRSMVNCTTSPLYEYH